MKSALFVDFDNVYSGLRRLDPMAADRFALEPLNWIRWLTDDLAAPPHAPDGACRRLLVRRCYLNPQVYQRFRPAFNRAGFEIVDCPAMTREGKTSTDIHMVLDIVELLQHQVHYDEFLVFSADADFTPVLRKLRRWDRRTTVLAIGFPCTAYQACADLLIDQDEFVRAGIGLGEPEPEPPPTVHPHSKNDGLAAVGELVRAEVATAGRAIPCGRLAQLISDRHGAIAADWGGKGTFRRLLESLDLGPLRIDWTFAGGHVTDPRFPPLAGAAATRRALPDWGPDDELLQVIRQVHATTGMPLLAPSALRALLTGLADDLEHQPFQLAETGKRVRDRCREAGHSINRADVSFVLKGILLGGHIFDQGNDTAASLARPFIDSVLDLCRREQLSLDDTRIAQLRDWAARATALQAIGS